MFDRGKSAATVPSTAGGHGLRRLGAISALVLLLFGALAGAMSGTKTGTSTLQDAPASNVATVALTLAAVIAVVMLVATMWGFFIRAHDDRYRRNRKRSTMLQRALAGAIFGVCVGVAGLASRLLRHPHPQHVSGAGAGQNTAPVVSHSALYFSRGAATGTVAVVLALVLGGLLLSRIGAVRRRRPWSLGSFFFEPSRASAPPLSEQAALADTLVAVRIPDPELESDPRKAVVAAYVAMTHAAGESGAHRRIDETPSEYLERLLESLGASSGAARRLTSCFEAARYSSQAMDETFRSDAIDALRRIRAELGASSARADLASAMAPATT